MGTHDRIRSHDRPRKDRQIDEVVNDPYRERYKPDGASFCPTCGAVFHDGRWQWGEKQAGAHEHVCPACHRIRDALPAGHVTLSGPFLGQHRDEIIGLLHNEAARVKAEHPLERIMQVTEEHGQTVVTTTDLHLARRIGEALHHAWQGELELKYSPDEYLVRVSWQR